MDGGRVASKALSRCRRVVPSKGGSGELSVVALWPRNGYERGGVFHTGIDTV
jgi:hypothetical protein